jgi:3-phenylpropionate/cinnamic acid dioxygenase small subunit
MAAAGSDQALIEFVYHEARLIDEKRFDEWYDLFADDGRYWMPLMRGQPEGPGHTSLFDEDKLLLKIRIERLGNPKSYSQACPSWCQHILQAPRIERREAGSGLAVLRTPFMYLEYQQDQQEIYAGVAWHHLKEGGAKIMIALKKIELLNCEAALPSLQLFP